MCSFGATVMAMKPQSVTCVTSTFGSSALAGDPSAIISFDVTNAVTDSSFKKNLMSGEHSMRVLLGFHYRDDGSRRREQIFGRVRPIVESLYSWDKVVVCDSGHTPYNRAASRNEVVKI